MTGTCDITTCADIVYGKHFRITFHRLIRISRVPVPGRTLLENGIRYRNSDFTAA